MAKTVKKKAALDTNWKQLLVSQPELIKKKKKRKTEGQGSNVFKEQPPPKKQSSKSEIWFDDVDEIYLEKHVAKPSGQNQPKHNLLVKENAFNGFTRAVAMDCEMVGTGDDGKESILARVSIVNHFGQCIYDKYVKPVDEVTDYRTAVSGIRPSDVENGEDFKVVQKEVNDIMKKRVIVGHALRHDLKALFLQHPRKDTRDTSKYQPFRKLFNGNCPSLKRLTERVLGVQIQDREHDSVQDAQAAMRLYTMHRKRWEQEMQARYRRSKPLKRLEKSKGTGWKLH